MHSKPPLRLAAGIALAAAALSLTGPASGAPAPYAGYSLPINLAKLTNARVFKPADGYPAAVQLSSAQRNLLVQNGFVVTPASWKRFDEAYESGRYGGLPVFVTTDSVLHVYHLIFDKMLRDAERSRFTVTLKALTASLQSAALQQARAAKGTPLERPASMALAYLAVANKLADPKASVPTEVSATVQAELALIAAHAGKGTSPLTGQLEDYGQYVPRGHYDRDATLSNYFRAMQWLGRINFRLKSPTETQAALLLTRLIENTPDALRRWQSLYEPTSLLIGRSDDLGYNEYQPLAEKTFGSDLTLATLADPAKLAAFTTAARALPAPKVNSAFLTIDQDKKTETQGFRVMGQRFVLDAYIMGELIWRQVGTLERQRFLPKGLDVLAALGSNEAYAVLKKLGENQYANYDAQLAKVRAEVQSLGTKDWNANVYTGWLNTLRAVIEPRGQTYPPFMRTTAWARKDLHTALGSWTELKHDTVLYAKQVMQERGGGPEDIPRGYVEPVATVYARLLDLVRQTRDVMARNKALSNDTAANLTDLSNWLSFLKSASERELAGTKLTADEYERLHYYGGWLEEMTLKSTDTLGGEGSPTFDEQTQAAIVTDVATDPNGKVLQEATGRVYDMLVVVPDPGRGLQLAYGATYSYYEFVGSMTNRLTDTQWRAQLAAKKAPAQPEWTKSFIAP